MQPPFIHLHAFASTCMCACVNSERLTHLWQQPHCAYFISASCLNLACSSAPLSPCMHTCELAGMEAGAPAGGGDAQGGGPAQANGG